jgi:hypothetical protein
MDLGVTIDLLGTKVRVEGAKLYEGSCSRFEKAIN